MKTITIEVDSFELNELYDAIMYKKDAMIRHIDKVSKWDNSEKVVKILKKRIQDLDNIHSKIANSEKLNSK